MDKLLEIERAVGIADPIQVRQMVVDAEDVLIEMQRSTVAALMDAERRHLTDLPRWHRTNSTLIGDAPDGGRKSAGSEDRRMSPLSFFGKVVA